MNRLDRVTIASRAFCLAAIIGLTASAGSVFALQSAILIAAIAGAAAFVTFATRFPDSLVATGEALVVGLVIALALPSGAPLLLYLPVPALIAGISVGVRGVFWVVVAEVVSLVSITIFPLDSASLETYDLILPWVLTSVGVGLLGSLLRQMRLAGIPPSDASYESARRLVTQLRTVARRLSAGLDPVGMSAQLLATVHAHLADTRSGVFVRTEGGVLSPLGYRGVDAQEGLASHDHVVDACWAEMEPAHSITASGRAAYRYRTALPLRAGNRMIGVVLTDSPAQPDSETVDALMHELDEHSLRLDTALAFDEVRSIATAEERRRLAREIHDGVAQEIASLGYVVDELMASATTGRQREQLTRLRAELSRVVSELRLSIFDLRIEVNPSSGLGSALSDYVRQVGSRSKMTVHLTLDEAPTRLRGEVETELLRIAQEAITNARKHSGAKNLWVDCRILPPFARVEVRDDGGGLKDGREDSYGLRIMRERADRIDADLIVEATRNGNGSTGTLVRVTLGTDPAENDTPTFEHGVTTRG